ncbi:TetR/AcrR family transcriptional regulator [Streptomyces tubercidicus]|uniref:TetR/AcrR family transcriptional regulator n=1 Tax=Streptomyces tubercidicus TaxID=47759 RepID=UPI002E12DBAB|nr:TetR/AcrR family transcriptional regulator [Streptomyces tubercidicus]
MRSDDAAGRTFIEAARRRQFIDSAIETLDELGFSGASTAEVARRASIAKSALFYHFKNKDELLHAVVNDLYALAAQEIVKEMATVDGPRQRLIRYIRTCILFASAHPRWIRAATEVIQNLRDPDGALVFGATTNQPNIDAIEQMLREGQRDGVFRDFATMPMAVSIRAAIDAAPACFAHNPGLDPGAYADEVAALFDMATRRTDAKETT